jgi:hypothetical protein
VLVVGHPFVDVWAAVKPERLGLAAWPTSPRRRVEERRLRRARLAARRPGRHRSRLAADPGRVRSYADCEPALLGPGRGADRLRDRVLTRPTLLPCARPPTSSRDTRSALPWLVLAGILVSPRGQQPPRPLTNTDTYFHLRFGHEFLHGWSLRHPGSVSTFATADWVPTQWLSEIVMAKTEDWFGLPGVALVCPGLLRGAALPRRVRPRRAWRAEPLVAMCR